MVHDGGHIGLMEDLIPRGSTFMDKLFLQYIKAVINCDLTHFKQNWYTGIHFWRNKIVPLIIGSSVDLMLKDRSLWPKIYLIFPLWMVLTFCFTKYFVCLFVCLMVFNATFNNISFISWWSVLLVKETGISGENDRPVTSHWYTL